MKKIKEIKLYKAGEVVDILGSEFNYKTDNTMICRKARHLGAYVVYNNMRYIPEDIIRYLGIDMKPKAIRFKTQAVIKQKIEEIKKILNLGQEQNKNFTKKTLNTNTTNTKEQNTLLQIQKEMQNIKEIIQKDIKNKHVEIKNLKQIVQKTKEELQEELQLKNKEIIKLKKEIENIKEQKEKTKQLNFIQEFQQALSILNNIYMKTHTDNKNQNNKKI